jgi:hypothetical protein
MATWKQAARAGLPMRLGAHRGWSTSPLLRELGIDVRPAPAGVAEFEEDHRDGGGENDCRYPPGLNSLVTSAGN